MVVRHAPEVNALDATPAPKLVIALGDCAVDCGVFRDGYGVAGAVNDVVPVDVEVRGCPPDPDKLRNPRAAGGTTVAFSE